VCDYLEKEKQKLLLLIYLCLEKKRDGENAASLFFFCVKEKEEGRSW